MIIYVVKLVDRDTGIIHYNDVHYKTRKECEKIVDPIYGKDAQKIIKDKNGHLIGWSTKNFDYNIQCMSMVEAKDPFTTKSDLKELALSLVRIDVKLKNLLSRITKKIKVTH